MGRRKCDICGRWFGPDELDHLDTCKECNEIERDLRKQDELQDQWEEEVDAIPIPEQIRLASIALDEANLRQSVARELIAVLDRRSGILNDEEAEQTLELMRCLRKVGN